MSVNSILNSITEYWYDSFVQKYANGDESSVEAWYGSDGDLFLRTDDGGAAGSINLSEISKQSYEELLRYYSFITGYTTQDTEESNNDARLSKLESDAEQKEGEIKSINDEIKNIFDETLEEQGEITKNEYLRILDVVDDSVAQFMAARENGEDVDFSTLNSTIMAGVEDSTYENDIAAVFGNLETANTKIQKMSTLLQGYNSSIVKEAETILADACVPQAGGSELLEPASLSFACNNFSNIYSIRLGGHEQLYGLISDFEELDDSIIQMYTEYAGSVSTTVQELLSKQEADDSKETEEIEETDETEAVGSNEEEYDNEEYEEAKAA